jgi:ESAT-6 family protein
MTVIAWTDGGMDAAVSQIRATLNQLQTQFDQLQGYINQLAQSWSGTDQQAYQAYQGQWNRTATELNQELKGMGSGVSSAHQNLTGASMTNARGW